jgi:hypothetical protein
MIPLVVRMYARNWLPSDDVARLHDGGAQDGAGVGEVCLDVRCAVPLRCWRGRSLHAISRVGGRAVDCAGDG